MPLIESSGSSGGGGGSGTVTNVSSADTSIVVTNPTTTPSLKVGTMDVLFTNEPPAASVPMNTQKLTGLAAGTGAGDSVRFEQVVKSGAVTAADTSIVVAGTGVAPTIATGTLDVIATQHPPAASVPMNTQKLTGLAAGTTNGDSVRFEQVVKSGAVSAADASIVVAGTGVAPTIATGTLDVIATNHPPAAAVALNAQKITGLANGSAATDAAAFGQLSGLGFGLSLFGDGSDGSVVFDGSTTILGMAPSSSIYTLTRDFYFSAVTLNNNVQIKTNGFRIFCSGAFTGGGSGAIIQWNGAAGVVTAAGAGTNNASSSINIQVGGTSPGTQGGAGGTAAGTAGTNSTNPNLGGVGGTGGTGSGGAGGAGGTITALTATQGSIRAAPGAIILKAFGGASTGTALVQISGGTGAGGGGGDGTAGGGGGGGGGIVCVYARSLAGTGAIQARGGAGGTPAGGNRGGGGGGGGGLVVVVSQSVLAGAVSGWTIDAGGGTHGNLTGTGTNGADGAAGTVILLTA